MSNFDSLWVEKYRPRTLDDIILSEDNRNYFKNIINDIPHLLFVGKPGIGKTTLARIIVQDILKCQYLYLNASDENGIDVIRTKVTNFAQTKSIDGKIKVIILDESDGLTQDAQAAMRNKMEEFSSHTRFILTANYKNKIIQAIQSRTQYFDLTPPFVEYVRRIAYVLKEEGIKIEDNDRETLLSQIKSVYPDFRKAINNIQKSSIKKSFKNDDNNSTETIKTIHEYISNKNTLALRQNLINAENSFQGDYHSLLKQYLNFIYNSNLDDNLKKEFILNISEYLYRDAFVLDKEINAFACFCSLEKILNS
jgi:replication factor C small subunit